MKYSFLKSFAPPVQNSFCQFTTNMKLKLILTLNLSKSGETKLFCLSVTNTKSISYFHEKDVSLSLKILGHRRHFDEKDVSLSWKILGHRRITHYFNVTTAAKDVGLSRWIRSRWNIVRYLVHLGLRRPEAPPLDMYQNS